MIRVLSHSLVLSFLLLVNVVPVSADAPVLPKGKGEFCVEPTDIMRREHMNFLLHQRDQTVHDGIRTKKHSLVECVNCHVQSDDSGKNISVNAPGQFCQSCHAFASVKLDCFECHASKPDESDHAVDRKKPVTHKLTVQSSFHFQ